MELKTAIIILKNHQDWRRGAEIEPTDPVSLGIAIDTVLEIVTKYHELNQLEVQKNKYTITALDDIVRCHLESLSTKQIKP